MKIALDTEKSITLHEITDLSLAFSKHLTGENKYVPNVNGLYLFPLRY